MRVLLSVSLALGLAAIAGTAIAQMSNGTVTYSDGGAMPTGQVGYYSPMPDGPRSGVPTRYETSIAVLKAEMAHRAKLDGGMLTPKHEAEFQQALNQTNRHFHKGPFAPQ